MATGEVVRNSGFEGTLSASDWVLSSNWGQGSSNYHGGAKYDYFGDTATGTGANNLSGSMSQQVTIPATMAAPTLTFWSKTTTVETTTTTVKDKLIVSIQDANGATTLANLVTISNINGLGVTTTGTRPAYTATGKYTPYTFTLPTTLIGQTVRINFAASTDSANPTMFRI